MQPFSEDERNLEADFRRKQVRIAPPKAMRDVLGQLLARQGYARVQSANSCDAAWREAVGVKLAADSRPGVVKRGVLEVLVRDSVTLQELGFVKVKAVRTLAKLIPEQQIRDMRFRVGALD